MTLMRTTRLFKEQLSRIPGYLHSTFRGTARTGSGLRASVCVSTALLTAMVLFGACQTAQDTETSVAKANRLWEDGKREQSLKHLDQAIEKNKKSAELRVAKMQYLIEDRQYDEALIETRESIRLIPESPELYQVLGKLYRTIGDDTKAHNAYRQAARLYSNEIRKRPWDEKPIIGRAYTYYYMGQINAARRDCEQARRITVRENLLLELIEDIERVQRGEEAFITDNLDRDRDL